MAAGGWIPLVVPRGVTQRLQVGVQPRSLPLLYPKALRPVRVHKRINNIRALPGRAHCLIIGVLRQLLGGIPMAAGGWIPLASLKVDRSTSRGCTATP